MGYSSVVVSVLALSALAVAVPSIGDNSLDAGERVVLVSPVLAPPRDSRLHDATRSRQFPILVLLAQANPQYGRQEPEAKSLKNPQPIYVQKLEDQEQPGLNRQKRHSFKKIGYGGGYGGGHGGGYGGHGGGYQQPSKVIIVNVVKQRGHGGGHHHGGGGYGGGGGYRGGGGYGGYQQPYHGGGGYGGYGGSSASATATATATATAQAGGYGKR